MAGLCMMLDDLLRRRFADIDVVRLSLLKKLYSWGIILNYQLQITRRGVLCKGCILSFVAIHGMQADSAAAYHVANYGITYEFCSY